MKYISPKSKTELYDTLMNNFPFYILNGGTDLIVRYNEEMLEEDRYIIDISKIK